MAEHIGWRSFWWWNTALCFFTSLVNLCLFPETRYHRDVPALTGERVSGGVLDEKNADDVGTTPAAAATTNNGHSNGGGPRGTGSIPTGAVTGEHAVLGRGHPSKAQFGPWSRYEGNLLRELWLPWYLHIYPIVEFAAFVVSFSSSGFLLANLTQQQAFAPPPYDFSSQSVGFTNFAILAGGFFGLLTSGPLSDWVADYLTRRNNGVREPEMRLVAMVPYVVVMIIGCVITGVGYQRKWPWEAIVVVGYTFLGIQVTSLPSIASTYAIDSYKPITGSLFVTITM